VGDPAKAYDPATSITKRDVDTFLSESGRPEFSFRLLIATTNLIGRTAKRTIDAQEKQASVLLLGDLEAAEIDWPSFPSDLSSRRMAPKRPKPHQREAINTVVKGFDRNDRGQLIMACGTGKTLKLCSSVRSWPPHAPWFWCRRCRCWPKPCAVDRQQQNRVRFPAGRFGRLPL
jgi:predicted helicase